MKAIVSALASMTEGQRVAALTGCCASSAWVRSMIQRGPFEHDEAILSAATEEWWALTRDDWLEAFAAHPLIGGDIAALEAKFGTNAHHSATEQAGVYGASRKVLESLSRRNLDYEARFGHVFLVFATGKTAAQMLALLEARIDHEPDVELRLAAAEHVKITDLRLRRLAEAPSGRA